MKSFFSGVLHFISLKKYDIVASVVSAVLVAFIFFILSDCCFSLPSLSGKWEFESLFTSSPTIQGYRLRFEVLVQQSGPSIQGSAEKVAYTTSEKLNWKKESISERSQLIFTGYISKKYFSRSELVIHFSEKNPKSKYDIKTIHFLKCVNDKNMKGTFVTSRGGHSGFVTWKRIDN